MPLSESIKNEPEAVRAAAAVIIQRLWRGRNNQLKERYLNPDSRWNDAITNARFEGARSGAFDGRNSPRRRWKRAAFLVGRMEDHDDILKDEGFHMELMELESKELETQHWLELVDGKHRYGSNLKFYHRKWLEDKTTDNFFRWLDQEGGKHLDLSECPRETLESECIRYLSAEQRLNYLVNISDDGRLLWAKNNQHVDTTAGHWKDAGDGSGIISQNVPTREQRPPGRLTNYRDKDANSDTQDAAGTHYVGEAKGSHTWSRFLRSRFTLQGVVDRLLRKTVRKDTWMYISDRNFNIFIGIKETGNFQHSSFLSGGLVTSAGLIKVKYGRIYRLSPLSGHYRTSVEHFRQFIRVLNERGVDMSRVYIGKEEAILRTVEHLAKVKKKQKRMTKSGKQAVKHVAEEVNPLHWKREVIEGRGNQRE